MRTPLESCTLCPHACHANRIAGEKGRCGAGERTKIYRYAPHHGEEPPLSGTRGSGTIFFAHCTLRCIYCQNYPWSQENRGDLYSEADLITLLSELAEAGCHNWNLVSPTPWLPLLLPAVQHVKQAGIRLPVVYNSSGFETKQTLTDYAELIDIALLDLRYASAETAAEASAAPKYVEIARDAIKHCWEMLGPLECDDDGIARKGVICRILVLPGHADEACETLRWIANNIGNRVAVSLMSQYTPVYRAADGEPWNRRVAPHEYEAVTACVADLGFENGWIQELDDSPPEGLLGCTMQPEGRDA